MHQHYVLCVIIIIIIIVVVVVHHRPDHEWNGGHIYTQCNSSHEKENIPHAIFIKNQKRSIKTVADFLWHLYLLLTGCFHAHHTSQQWRANTTAFLWRVYYVNVYVHVQSTIHGTSNKHFFRRWWIAWFWTRRCFVERRAIWVHHTAERDSLQCKQCAKHFIYFSLYISFCV